MALRRDAKKQAGGEISQAFDNYESQLHDFRTLLFSSPRSKKKAYEELQKIKESIVTQWRSKSHQFRVLFAGGTIRLTEFSLRLGLVTHDQLKDYFARVARLGIKEIAVYILENNKSFANWFYGRLTYIGADDERVECQALHSELLGHFELALECGSEEILEQFVSNNEYLERALLYASTEDKADYIALAKDYGYVLQILPDENRIAFSTFIKKRKAEEELELEREIKRPRSDGASQTPAVERRYFRDRSAPAAKPKIKFFDKQSQEKSQPALVELPVFLEPKGSQKSSQKSSRDPSTPTPKPKIKFFDKQSQEKSQPALVELPVFLEPKDSQKSSQKSSQRSDRGDSQKYKISQ